MKKNLLVALLGAALVPTAHADLNSGIVAYARGDFNTAAQQLLPLAETANNCVAQRILGDMYAKGKGVDPDMAAAVKWYKAAAEQGESASQYELGALYRDGTGLPKDLENAYAWMTVSKELGSSRAAAGLDALNGQLSPDELANAQKLAETYKAKHGKSCTKQDDEGKTTPIKADGSAPAE
jgi:hypothetical protein